MTLFEMKEKIFSLTNERKSIADWIAEKAADPNVPMDEITAKQTKMDELTARIKIMQQAHDDEEEAQRQQLAMQKGGGAGTGMTEKEVIIKAKAAFYRAALTGGDVKKAYEGLGALPAATADLGFGENLLPTNLSNELLMEPLEENSLRRIEPVSQVTGLEEAKLLFEIEDADLADVTDQETAKEIAMEGSTVSYGRYKTKITATIKDTVLHGTDFALVTAVENALRSGLAIKEKINAFRVTADGTHDHMSFYLNGIKEVPGSNLIQAIINAWADLPEAFAANAKCVMRKTDYYAAIQTMANGDNLWGKKPEDVIGIPVEFNDRAVTPIVGNFQYSRQNYDIGTIFENDKDGKKGEYYFILTAWGDHRIRLKSAFRLAVVDEAAAASAENP